MLKNYLKIAIRNIYKNKVYSFINIAGFAIGIAACIFILLWVTDELSFNNFNKNLNRIFLVPQTQHYQTIGDFTVAVTPPALSPALKAEYPEIEQAARYEPYLGGQMATYQGNSFKENVVFADPSFLNIFNFKFLKGNKNNALTDPHSIILTQETALKYFGNDDPIGKILRVHDKIDFKVSAIIQDIPKNSSIQFQMLASLVVLKEFNFPINSWEYNSLSTFILLRNYKQAGELSTKIADRLKRENNDPITGRLFLFPFKDIHLYSLKGTGGRITYVIIFSIIAFFILIIACINFMNLTTARSAKRAVEVGIKKVVGATRLQIAKQFFGESVILTLISLTFATLLVEILLPLFNQVSGKELRLQNIALSTVLLIIGITIITGILSGIYPSIILSSFSPSSILKKSMLTASSKFSLRGFLVVLQFAISIILIIGTSIVYLQLHYMQNKNLGLDKNNIVYFPLDDKLQSSIDNLKNELVRSTKIISATYTSNIPTEIYSNGGGWNWAGKPRKQDELVTFIYTDYDFLKTFNIKLKEGRFYSKEYVSDDSSSIVINESFAKLIGGKSPVGKELSWGDNHYIVIGIVKDFDYTSLQSKIGPLVILPNLKPQYMFIKVNNANLNTTLNYIQRVCKNIDPKFYFDYHFLDQTYEKTFESEKRLGKIISSFSILAIIISCLGLFGLTSYVTELKTKEIGIRKVLGASVKEIVVFLSKEFTKWVLIANVIACPVAYYFMHKWLEGFAYRITMSVWVFVASACISLVIAVLTISFQAIKAATANPVKSLRYQ